MSRSSLRALLTAGVFSAAVSIPGVGVAARAAGSGRTLTSIALEAGSGRTLQLTGSATNVFAADPKVAEVRPASANSIFVFGVGPGHTTIAAINGSGNSVGTYSVDVLPSAAEARSTRRGLDQAMSATPIDVRQNEHGLTLTGQVATPAEAQQATAIARDTIGKDDQIQNRLRLPGSVQVSLRVRIAEMSRTLTRELGINWQSVNALGTQAVIGVSGVAPIATLAASASSLSFLSRFNLAGRSATLDTVIEALSQDQLVHMLAEPNLTTVSGEPASFLVGGEFPIPVATNDNNITIDFKQYGISLAFVPTVLSDGQISLHVRPEVSQLTDQGAVSLTEANSTIKIPALTVRRADTTIELGSGQSFAIAGLLQDSTSVTGLGLPGLGDIPILGALFRSDSFQRNQSELVIVVTPYIVKPVSDPQALHLPTDGWRAPNDLERILLLRQTARNGTAQPVHVPGDSGFIVE